jgi:hypothetical protein
MALWLCMTANAEVEPPRTAACCAAHVHDEMAHLRRARADVSRSAAQLVRRLAQRSFHLASVALGEGSCRRHSVSIGPPRPLRRSPSLRVSSGPG